MADSTASSSGYEVSMTTRVAGSSARISRQASIPEPSGRRTSITTMSGWKRRACSMDSAAVPASATTWKPSRRSRRATRPWRTTSWSSTTSRRSGRELRSVTVGCLRPGRGDAPQCRAGRRRHSHDDTRARAVGPLDRERAPHAHRSITHVVQPLVTAEAVGAALQVRVEAAAVVLDAQQQVSVLLSQDDRHADVARVALHVVFRFAHVEQYVGRAVRRHGPEGAGAALEVDLDVD